MDPGWQRLQAEGEGLQAGSLARGHAGLARLVSCLSFFLSEEGMEPGGG